MPLKGLTYGVHAMIWGMFAGKGKHGRAGMRRLRSG